MGWGLTICLWLGTPWFLYWFTFTLTHSRISHEYSSLFVVVINFIFICLLWCIDDFFMYFCIKISIGIQKKVVSCKSALTPLLHTPGGLSYWRVGPDLLLSGVCYEAICFKVFLPGVILFLRFLVLWALRLPRLEESAILSGFCTFVPFALVRFCLFPLPVGVWEGLQLVIVVLPGLFSYLFYDV